MRPMGKITFAHIEDGEGRVQLFLRANEVGEEALDLFTRQFDLGDFVQAIRGDVPHPHRRGDPAGERLPHAGEGDHAPARRQRRGGGRAGRAPRHAERRRERATASATPTWRSTREVRQIFRTRAAVVRGLRSFLDERGFLEVETPILQPLYGGAAARPFITHHNQLKQDLYLRISFELYLKRLLVGGPGAGLRDRARLPQRGRRPSRTTRSSPSSSSTGPTPITCR